MVRYWSLLLFAVVAARAQPVSTWSVQATGTTANLWGVAVHIVSSNPVVSRVVAVGEKGTILVSTDDGVSWSRVDSGTTAWLTAVTYAQGLNRFFAVGDGGVILSSNDGLTWIAEVSPTGVRLNGVRVYTNAASDVTVLAVGEAGSGLLVRRNGVWSRTEVGFGPQWLRGVEGGHRLVVGAGGAMFQDSNWPSAFSTGSAWRQLPSITSLDLEDMVMFDPTRAFRSIIVVGAGGVILQRVRPSFDFPFNVEFVLRESGTTEHLRGVCYKRGGLMGLETPINFFDVGELFAVGTNGKILRSSNGTAWQSDVSPTSRNLNDVEATPTAVIVVGDGGTILRNFGTRPKIIQQPSIGLDEFGRPFIEAKVTGDGAVTYHWGQPTGGYYYDAGMSGPRQLLPPPRTSPRYPGSPLVYQLSVYNAFGMDRSETVMANRFVDLAARAQVGVGSDILIGGFSVVGWLPPLGRNLLIRAVGPGLTEFGVGTPLRAPVLTVYSNGEPIASNRGWETNDNVAGIVAATGRMGTFPLRTGRADSALLLNLKSGNYTAHVESGDGTTGVALVEIYDVDGHELSHLGNISARARVRTGEHALIGGLVIEGVIPKKVLLRAAGPALTAFNLTDVLAEPKLTLYRDGIVVATATRWGAAANLAELRTTSSALNAFAFAEGSKDAAMLIELPAGAYTLAVTGADGGEGLALVEVYHVPAHVFVR